MFTVISDPVSSAKPVVSSSLARQSESLTMNTTMAMTIVPCGNCYVSLWLHTDQNPSVELWNEGMERIAEVKKKLGGDPSKVRTLAISDGGSPNAVQRNQLFIDLLEGKSKVAGVSAQLSNRLLRGVAQAIAWLNPNFRAFGPDKFNLALEHLELMEYRAEIVAALQELQKVIQPIQTMALCVQGPAQNDVSSGRA
jgi:hypothetical protein